MQHSGHEVGPAKNEIQLNTVSQNDAKQSVVHESPQSNVVLGSRSSHMHTCNLGNGRIASHKDGAVEVVELVERVSYLAAVAQGYNWGCMVLALQA